jgi:hypothetical protein
VKIERYFEVAFSNSIVLMLIPAHGFILTGLSPLKMSYCDCNNETDLVQRLSDFFIHSLFTGTHFLAIFRALFYAVKNVFAEWQFV